MTRRHRGGEPAGRRRAGGVPGQPANERDSPIFNRLALIGIGLIGSSIARAARAQGGRALDRRHRALGRDAPKRVAELGLADQVVETNAAAVEGADLVIVCIPVGACGAVAAEIGPHLTPGAIVSDVGSVKGSVMRDMAPHMPAGVHFVPGHPVAGTEYSGPGCRLRRAVRQPLVHPDAAAGHRSRRRSSGWRRSGARSAPMSRP